MDVQTTLIVVAVVCALTTVSCSLYVRFSGPSEASRIGREVLNRLEEVEGEWRRKRVDLDGLVETMFAESSRATTARNRASALEAKRLQRDREGGNGGQLPRAKSREAIESDLIARGVMGRGS